MPNGMGRSGSSGAAATMWVVLLDERGLPEGMRYLGAIDVGVSARDSVHFLDELGGFQVVNAPGLEAVFAVFVEHRPIFSTRQAANTESAYRAVQRQVVRVRFKRVERAIVESDGR